MDMMLRVLTLQLAAMAMAVAACGFFVGTRGGISAALGGLTCTLSNLLLGCQVKTASTRRAGSFVVGFFLGEIVKLAVIFCSLLVIAKKYDDLHWPSLLIGLVLSTYALLFLVFWKKG